MGFPGDSAGKESACNAGDLGSVPGLGKSLGEGNGYPLQYSGLENSMDCTDPGVTESLTRLSDFHLLNVYVYAVWCGPPFFPREVKMYQLTLYQHVTTWTYLLTQLPFLTVKGIFLL